MDGETVFACHAPLLNKGSEVAQDRRSSQGVLPMHAEQSENIMSTRAPQLIAG